MAIELKKTRTFTPGLITAIGDEELKAGSCSTMNNFMTFGDRIELVGGQLLLGNRTTGSGKCRMTVKAYAVDGSEVLFRKTGTKIQHYNSTTENWDDAKTGLPDEDGSFAEYRTPAGSFVFFSSPTSGLYRVNVANPLDWTDLYVDGTNYKGFITVSENRMWLWRKRQDETVLYLSHIDDDWPYTAIVGESWGTGDGYTKTFTGTAAHTLIAGRTVSVSDTVETFTDDGMGILTGSAGGTGTINYTTGAYSVTFVAAPAGAQDIAADYDYETPNTDGVTDFSYSSPRLAGEGDFLLQGKGSRKLQLVLAYDEKHYCFHENSTWVVDLTADDTNGTNRVYRENIGIPGPKAAVATGEGIYLLDERNETGAAVRLLAYNDKGERVVPKDVSEVLDLDSHSFDEDTALRVFGDYLFLLCKSSSSVSYNDTAFIYNRKWKNWSEIDLVANDLVEYDGKPYMASSVQENVFEILSGHDDDGDAIEGTWTGNDDTLGTEEAKRLRRLVVEGDMSENQELIVEMSYDGDEFVEIGKISGSGIYVDTASSTEYGKRLYGVGTLGSNTDATYFRYMRRFRITQPRFYRSRIRFRTEKIGYLNVRMYRFDDIRKLRHKLPQKFRE